MCIMTYISWQIHKICQPCAGPHLCWWSISFCSSQVALGTHFPLPAFHLHNRSGGTSITDVGGGKPGCPGVALLLEGHASQCALLEKILQTFESPIQVMHACFSLERCFILQPSKEKRGKKQVVLCSCGFQEDITGF